MCACWCGTCARQVSDFDRTTKKKTDGTPQNILWIEKSAGDEKATNNSDHLMKALKLWDMELPNM